MILLRLAALVAAVTTIVLNAHAGYVAASTPEYAILFATLSAALDIAKCALIPAGIAAFRRRALLVGLLAFALFPLLFANSVWNAVSQVTTSRETAKTSAVSDIEAHTRAEATYQRLSHDLDLMRASPTFAATAGCTLPKTKPAHAFCASVERAKNDIAAAETTLAAPKPADPSPHITLLAAITGVSRASLTLALNVIPVLLAELVGSLGFVIAGTDQAREPALGSNRTKRLRKAFRWFGLPKPRPALKNSPAASVEPSAVVAEPKAAPVFQWSLNPPA